MLSSIFFTNETWIKFKNFRNSLKTLIEPSTIFFHKFQNQNIIFLFFHFPFNFQLNLVESPPLGTQISSNKAPLESLLIYSTLNNPLEIEVQTFSALYWYQITQILQRLCLIKIHEILKAFMIDCFFLWLFEFEESWRIHE